MYVCMTAYVHDCNSICDGESAQEKKKLLYEIIIIFIVILSNSKVTFIKIRLYCFLINLGYHELIKY